MFERFIAKVSIVLFMLSFIVMIFMTFCRSYKHFKGLDKTDDANFLHAFVNRLYFVLTTFCTIGYGDITPATMRCKIITIIILLSIFVAILKVFDSMIDHYNKNFSGYVSKIAHLTPIGMLNASQDKHEIVAVNDTTTQKIE